MVDSKRGEKDTARLGLEDAQNEAASVRETAEIFSRVDLKSDSSGHPLGEHYRLADEVHTARLEEVGRERYEKELIPSYVRAEIAELVGPEIFRKFHQTITDILLEKRSIFWNPTIRINEIYSIMLRDVRMNEILSALKKQHRNFFERMLEKELKMFISAVEKARMESYLAEIEKRRILQG